jgi:hypothetical protein
VTPKAHPSEAKPTHIPPFFFRRAYSSPRSPTPSLSTPPLSRSPPPPPREKPTAEIVDYAKWLGMDLEQEKDLMVG